MTYVLKQVSDDDLAQAQAIALQNNTEGLASVTADSDSYTFSEIVGQFDFQNRDDIDEIRFETHTGDYSNIHFRVGRNWFVPVVWEDVKRDNRQQFYRSINKTDDNSNSGIQTWSRFTPVTTEDCHELGFVYGSNNRLFEEGSDIAYAARGIEGMRAYRAGYSDGMLVHHPFNDNHQYTFSAELLILWRE